MESYHKFHFIEYIHSASWSAFCFFTVANNINFLNNNKWWHFAKFSPNTFYLALEAKKYNSKIST